MTGGEGDIQRGAAGPEIDPASQLALDVMVDAFREVEYLDFRTKEGISEVLRAGTADFRVVHVVRSVPGLHRIQVVAALLESLSICAPEHMRDCILVMLPFVHGQRAAEEMERMTGPTARPPLEPAAARLVGDVYAFLNAGPATQRQEEFETTLRDFVRIVASTLEEPELRRLQHVPAHLRVRLETPRAIDVACAYCGSPRLDGCACPALLQCRRRYLAEMNARSEELRSLRAFGEVVREAAVGSGRPAPVLAGRSVDLLVWHAFEGAGERYAGNVSDRLQMNLLESVSLGQLDFEFGVLIRIVVEDELLSEADLLRAMALALVVMSTCEVHDGERLEAERAAVRCLSLATNRHSSTRHELDLERDAMHSHDLPEPLYAQGDTGATIGAASMLTYMADSYAFGSRDDFHRQLLRAPEMMRLATSSAISVESDPANTVPDPERVKVAQAAHFLLEELVHIGACRPFPADIEELTDCFRNGRFDRRWRALEQHGTCDGLGGCEYTRVRREWNLAGQPSDIDAFIRWRANIGPNEPPFTRNSRPPVARA